MLEIQKIFEHLFVIMLGFATYETVYLDRESSTTLDASYFYTVLPILFCTIWSVICSMWGISETKKRFSLLNDENAKIKKINRNIIFLLVISIYFEFRVFFMVMEGVNQRTAFCFALAFFLAKIAMYIEVHKHLAAVQSRTGG